jgi:hypothetical protein
VGSGDVSSVLQGGVQLTSGSDLLLGHRTGAWTGTHNSQHDCGLHLLRDLTQAHPGCCVAVLHVLVSCTLAQVPRQSSFNPNWATTCLHSCRFPPCKPARRHTGSACSCACTRYIQHTKNHAYWLDDKHTTATMACLDPKQQDVNCSNCHDVFIRA